MKNLIIFGEPLIDAVEQMKAIQNNPIRPEHTLLMADHHIGYSVPVGGVVAYKDHININGVGFDIACGNKAARIDVDANLIKADISQLMDQIQREISFGVGRKNNEKVEHPLLDDPLWNQIPFLRPLKDKAKAQLGTVGSGNHYVDVFVDEKNQVWIGVHFGSRGLGHSICTHFIKEGGGKDGVHAKPVIFHEHSDLGEQYIQCMKLAGEYAYAGRDWVCQKVASLLQGTIVEEVHNHHNFAWKETHFGKKVWVVRKGATPLFPGQKGFVGGSMGDISVILEGIDSQESKEALYSTVHGAGRVMGRIQAAGKKDWKTGRLLKPGLVNKQAHDAWIKKAGVELRGGGLDESPYAYKRIEEVLKAHEKTIRICHTLMPIGVAMASEKEFDPYRD